MLIAENKTRYTAKDYMLLEEGAPFQLINYDLIMSPSPNLYHQLISMRLIGVILDFLKKTNNKGLFLSAPMDVKLDDGNIFQPDLIFVSEGRIAEIAKDRIEGAPDLVVEILSPSTAYYDLKHKKSIYERSGVKEYVIIDPLEANAEIHRLRDQAFYLAETINIENDLTLETLPRFSLPLKQLFEQ